MFGVRVFWLVVLTLFGMAASTFVAAQQAIVLAVFITPIVDMGGNAGSQSATLVLRGMALGSLSLNWRDVWFVAKREMPVSACLGAAVAALEAILAGFGKGVGGDVLPVVAFAMALCTMLGGVVGAFVHFALACCLLARAWDLTPPRTFSGARRSRGKPARRF